jgi:phosphatidate cytidylyltransferase
MLKQRIITALILVAVLLAALVAPSPLPFALITWVMISTGGWEWARLNGLEGNAALALGAAIALGAWGMAAVGWVGAYALRAGVAAWPHHPRLVRLALGAAMLWLAWLAIAAARTQGVNLLLSIFCLVWMADVAAYFGGKALGRRKLAPSISPGKSWEGVVSGIVGVLSLALFWCWLDTRFAMDSTSLYTRLYARHGALGMLLALVFLTSMSVVGDLFESLVKRSAGAKDSSRLLPGHGGVLDRIDALLPVCPLALGLVA